MIDVSKHVPRTNGSKILTCRGLPSKLTSLLIFLSIQALNIEPIPDPIPTAESPLQAN